LWTAGDDQIPLASADQCGGLPVLDTSWLIPQGASYPQSLGRTLQASEDDHLDESNDNYGQASRDIYRAAAASQGTGDTAYARAYQAPDGTVWLEYWLWFYYNNGENPVHFDNHEGDWEHINLRLGMDLSPVKAIYGEHTYASKCDWTDVERSGDRPVVYVAQGRHASWFPSGEFGDYDDTNDGLGARATPHVELVSADAPGWIRWPGRWGSTNLDVIGDTLDTKSPRGPAFQAPWNAPGDEENDARTTNCPTQLSPMRSTSAGRRQSSDASGAGGLRPPTVRIQANGRQLRIAYSIRADGGPRKLLLSVRAVSSSLSQVKRVSVRRTRSGAAHLALPTDPGPYVFSASVLGQAGRSPTVQRAIP
jgi:hypothetical protein